MHRSAAIQRGVGPTKSAHPLSTPQRQLSTKPQAFPAHLSTIHLKYNVKNTLASSRSTSLQSTDHHSNSSKPVAHISRSISSTTPSRQIYNNISPSSQRNQSVEMAMDRQSRLESRHNSPQLNPTAIPSPTSHAFRSSQPTHSIARALAIGGVIGMGVGARYIVSGVLAFRNAYKATKEHLEPPSADKIEELQAEISEAAQAILDREEEWDQEQARKSERRRTTEYLKEHGKEPKNKFFNDDMSDHFDAKKEEQLKRERLDKYRDYMPPEDYHLKLLLDRYDSVFQAGPFEDPMSRLEAEKILVVSPSPCKEEVEDRYRVMMRLNHPDLGGSIFLSRKVNEARDFFLNLNIRSDPKWREEKERQKKAEMAERMRRAEEFAKKQAEKRGEKYHPPGEEPSHPDKM